LVTIRTHVPMTFLFLGMTVSIPYPWDSAWGFSVIARTCPAGIPGPNILKQFSTHNRGDLMNTHPHYPNSPGGKLRHVLSSQRFPLGMSPCCLTYNLYTCIDFIPFPFHFPTPLLVLLNSLSKLIAGNQILVSICLWE
jgi:hypothetical protein